MTIIEEAIQKMYLNEALEYNATIKYSGKFKGYNARVQLNKTTRQLTFKLSNNWQTISKEIQIGLLQSLAGKILKKPKNTLNIELYESFLKNLSNTTPCTKTHPVLQESFKRVNEKYFNGLLSMPNLDTKNSLNTLGTYEYCTDTVSITEILLEHQELIDYVMYHELLHKKHKFNSKNGRHHCHTPEFHSDEKKFENWQECEKKLNRVIKQHKTRGAFRFF